MVKELHTPIETRRPYFDSVEVQVINQDKLRLAWFTTLQQYIDRLNPTVVEGHDSVFCTFSDGTNVLNARLSAFGFGVESRRGDFHFQTRAVNGMLQGSACLVLSNGERLVRDPVMPYYIGLHSLSLSYYSNIGIPVVGEYQVWPQTHISNIPNPNYVTFFEALSNGRSHEEAAASTPSGKVAVRQGFSNIKVENVPSVPYGNCFAADGGAVRAHFLKLNK